MLPTSMFNTEWHNLALDWNANTKVFNIYVDNELYITRTTNINDGSIPKGTVMGIIESQGVEGGNKIMQFYV